jgi:hypothetical protein
MEDGVLARPPNPRAISLPFPEPLIQPIADQCRTGDAHTHDALDGSSHPP